MKKILFPLLAIIIGIPLLILSLLIYNYRRDIVEMCPYIYTMGFTTYEDRTIDEASSLLKDIHGEIYAGYAYNTNIYDATIIAEGEEKTTSVFLATKDIVNNYRFWVIKEGTDLTYSKIDGLMPILLGGRDYKNISVGEQVSITIHGEENNEYSIEAIVIGKIDKLKNIPEYEKLLYSDRIDYYSAFVVVPDIGDFSILRKNSYIFLWNTEHGEMPTVTEELYQIGFFNMFSNGFGRNIPYNDYNTISLIAVPSLLIVVGITILLSQIFVNISRKKQIRRIERSHYEKI